MSIQPFANVVRHNACRDRQQEGQQHSNHLLSSEDYRGDPYRRRENFTTKFFQLQGES